MNNLATEIASHRWKNFFYGSTGALLKSPRIAAIALFLWTLPLFAAEWTMFHGTDGENRSPDTGLLTSWPEGGPKLLWRIDNIGKGASGFSSVTIQNGRLFTAGSQDGRSIVYCFDLNGKPLWTYDNGPVWTRSYPGTRSTPTVDGEFVYDFSSMGQLTCLTVDKGQKVWSRNILTDFDGENPTWALAESIRIDGDRLYCSPGGKKASFVALNKRTGETIWTTPSLGEKTAYASPIIVEQDGLRMIITMYSKGVFGVNAANGELLFTFLHLQTHDVNCTRPIYQDGYLHLANALDQNGAGGGGVKLKVTVADGKVTLDEVWRDRKLDNPQDCLILLDGFLYGVSYNYKNGIFLCVDWKTGVARYEGRRLGQGSSLTWAEGLLYLYTDKGDVLLIRPNPEKFDVISQFNIPEGGEGATWAHPVVIGKRLYLRHGTFLYCYDVKAE